MHHKSLLEPIPLLSVSFPSVLVFPSSDTPPPLFLSLWVSRSPEGQKRGHISSRHCLWRRFRCDIGLTLVRLWICAESFMDWLWYEENANIQGALRATAWRGGWAAQKSLASQGCAAGRQRGFHDFSIGSVEVFNCSISLYFFSHSAGQLPSFPWYSPIGLAFKHWLACVFLSECVC